MKHQLRHLDVRIACAALLALAGLLSPGAVRAADPVLNAAVRGLPGEKPTPYLRYESAVATTVQISGSWDTWAEPLPLMQKETRWAFDVRGLDLPFGRYEYKFIVNGEWEPGANRFFHINDEGVFERPSPLIASATIEAPSELFLLVNKTVRSGDDITVTTQPPVTITETGLRDRKSAARLAGYDLSGGNVTFAFDEKMYDIDLRQSDRVVVAGSFNGWNPGNRSPRWRLQDRDDDGIWTASMPMQALKLPAGEKEYLFKFVINENKWLVPPADALNAINDGRGNVNLRIDAEGNGKTLLKVTAAEPFDLSTDYAVFVDGLQETPVWAPVSPGLRLLGSLSSDKKMGVELDRERGVTTYRLFSPRARSVHLCLYDQPYFEQHLPEYRKLPPVERYPMWKDTDGVWELSVLGLDIGSYYTFNVDGPSGAGEGFSPEAQIGDPYARAAAHARNNTIVMDPEATNKWFAGWTDQDYAMPPHEDLVIYETHVRHLTMHPSSGVTPKYRGKYQGLIDSLGKGTVLDHLKEIGVNAIEFLPVSEFDNGINDHNWGYATTYFFAPEASYGLDPLNGSQYYEFKNLVNELHRQGFAVILDVVYNHAGWPNVFQMIDRKYYFRLNEDFSYSNYSGVGNDIRSESPMTRRLIIDNILYWMEEFHIDGFRFDLAELIDLETLFQLRDEARALNPNVLLISEPWSFRGGHKHMLKGTGWAAWNDDFRYAAKGFALGERNREWLAKGIFGSVEQWTANPIQAVNYLESHDDYALADELCTAPSKDGRRLLPSDIDINLLAATINFTSLGILMIAEGQEFLRSKHGIHNSYDKGDAINAINWDDRERPGAKEAFEYYKGLLALRNSEAGQSFRVAEKPRKEYYRWIWPEEQRAFGYIVNAPKQHAGSGFVVLINGSGGDVSFTFDFPPGKWRLIGNGDVINMDGIEGSSVLPGGNSVKARVPSLKTHIYMDGF